MTELSAIGRKLRIYAILMRSIEIEIVRNNRCGLESVVARDIIKTQPITIFPLPRRQDIFIPDIPIFNAAKHHQSCLRNRELRKKRNKSK